MEFQGLNIMNDSGYCSDLFAIFFQHLRDCDDCFYFFFFYLILFVFFVSLFCVLFGFLSSLLEKLIDSSHYRKKYKELADDYEALTESYSNLTSEFHQLEEEYYHTCN